MRTIAKEIIQGAPIIATSEFNKKIRSIFPDARTVDLDLFHGPIALVEGKTYIVDKYYSNRVMPSSLNKGEVIYFKNSFSNGTKLFCFLGEITEFAKRFGENPAPRRDIKIYGRKALDDFLVEIKLKDINSVPEVFYKGEKISALLDVDFNWKTEDEDLLFGESELHISHLKDSEKIGYKHSKL